MPQLSLLIAVVLAQAAPRNAERTAPPDVDARRQQLAALLDEHWEYTMRTSPEYASMLGDKRYNDRLSDFSEKAVYADIEAQKQFLARLKAIDVAGFPEQEAMPLDVLEKRIAAWTAQGRQGGARGAGLH